MTKLTIPTDHWKPLLTQPHSPSYVQTWELYLRANIAKQPDPAIRFTQFLSARAKGEGFGYGVRLLFIEQPYLDWAEAVEDAIEKTSEDTRQQIAHNILNPNDH